MPDFPKRNSRTCTKRGSRRPLRHGAAIIEFALVLPVLVTIALGCVDFGRFAYTEIDVTNAARVGAEFASLHPFTTNTLTQWRTNIQTLVENELKNIYNYNANLLTLPNPVVTTDSDGQRRVQVQVTYPFSTLVSWPFIPNQVNIQRTTQMRIIR